jgi:hypothetical protein
VLPLRQEAREVVAAELREQPLAFGSPCGRRRAKSWPPNCVNSPWPSVVKRRGRCPDENVRGGGIPTTFMAPAAQGIASINTTL